MLANKDLYFELENAQKLLETTKDTGDLLKILIKVSCLQTKLLHNIRANQVAIMVNSGVELSKPMKKEGEDEGPSQRK